MPGRRRISLFICMAARAAGASQKAGERSKSGFGGPDRLLPNPFVLESKICQIPNWRLSLESPNSKLRSLKVE